MMIVSIKPNRPVVIWDIDGVLADDRLRAQAYLAKHDQFNEPRSLELRDECDWDGYYGALPHDRPYSEIVTLFRALHWHNTGIPTHAFGAPEAFPVFLTGRDDKYREETQTWLRENVHPYAGSEDVAPLYMRREGSELTNKGEKEHFLSIIRERHGVPVMAFEDNDDTVAFYRSKGIKCLQPNRAVPSGKKYKA